MGLGAHPALVPHHLLGVGEWGLGEEARQARLVVPVSMGHSRSNETGATSLACLIRADPRPNKNVAI